MSLGFKPLSGDNYIGSELGGITMWAEGLTANESNKWHSRDRHQQ